MAVPVDAAAAALSATPQQIISIGTSLVNAGQLQETPAGYQLATGVTPEVTPTVATYLAGHLADAMAAAQADPRQIGRLLVAAGRYAGAWRVLSEAALDESSRYSDSEQIDLLQTAFGALAEAKLDGGESEGRLRLRLARLYRNRGQTAAARTSLEIAIPRLSGEDLVDALGFAAAVEDDLQHPQEAERWVSLAELAATRANSPAKLGSLLTFHGRELSRLGFAEEATATVAKGQALLEIHGTETQRFYGRLNQAWIDLDQGQMRSAEIGFARLREEAATKEGEASQADKEAYWARALFGIGRPVEALEAIERAQELAAKVGAFAPVFISHLAAAEGGLLFEQWEVALEASDRALETALSSLPSWENVCRYLRARALAGRGSVEEARAEVEAALAATPTGSNGLRWRLRLEELQLELSDTWPQSRAEDLTDLLLQSRWLGAAADLMTVRAKREESSDLGAEAAALAMQLGNPVQAAKAITASKLWQDSIARPVASAMRSVVGHLPEDWSLTFLDNPPAQTALTTETEVGEEEVALLRERIDQALSAAGLSGEMVLSPAQRRSAGLVRRRPIRRRRGPLALAGTAAAMAVIAVGAALAVVNLTTEPTTTTRATTTTTTVLAIEDTPIAPPENRIAGTAIFRGDTGRSGIGSGGFRDLQGFYWRDTPGGDFTTSGAAFGPWVFLTTDENVIYGLEQNGGRHNLTITTDARVTGALAIARSTSSEDDASLVFATADGVVHSYNALRNAPERWFYSTDASVVAPILAEDDKVIVASTDGYLQALSLAGDPVWRYPLEESAGEFRTATAYHDGIVYAVSREGALHLVRIATGEAVCASPIGLIGRVETHPVISNGVVYVGLESGSFHAFAAGECFGLAAAGYKSMYPSDVPVRLSPAVTADTMYMLENRRLLALPLDASSSGDFAWVPYDALADITTPPVFADGVVYLGDQSGVVHAIDAATGTGLWSFDTGSGIRGEPIVVPGAVFVTTSAGEVIAIAGE